MIQQTKKRVLLVSHNSNLSGAPISLSHLARKLPSFGFSPLLLLPGPGPLVNLLKSWDIEYRILKRPNAVFDFIRIIKKERPVIIHVNSLVKTWPVLVSRLTNKPVIWHVREYLGNKKIYARLIHLFAYRVIVISQTQYRLFDGMKKAVYIPNGVDHSIFEGVHPAIDLINKKEEVRTIVTYIGSIEPRKGLLVLTRAAAFLSDRPKIHYVVVGDTPQGNERYKNEILDFIKKEGLNAQFHFFGYRNDIPEILASSDILCHPAFVEAFGRVVIEAMASRLPVIATDIGEMPKIVDDGHTGFLVPSGNHEAISKAVTQLDSDKELCKKMGNAGKKRSKEKYDIVLHAQRIAHLYDELLGSK